MPRGRATPRERARNQSRFARAVVAPLSLPIVNTMDTGPRAPGGPFRFDDKQNAVIPTYICRVEKVRGRLQNPVIDTVWEVDQFWKPPRR